MLISQAWLDILIHKEEGFSAFFPGCLGSFPRIWVLGKDKDFVGEYGATGGEHPAGPSRRGSAAPAKVLPAAWLAGGEGCAPGLPPQADLQQQVQALAGVWGEH